MGILKAMHDYSMTHRKPFNDELFRRSEYDIVRDVESIILSIASPTPVNTENKDFFIGINSFRVISDYREVRSVLYFLEDDDHRRNKRIDYNIYDFINLKDSAVILLEVSYHIELTVGKDEYGNKKKEVRDEIVYIDIPRVVNKYFFRIDGTEYFAYYQIADASTYSNSSSKKKMRSVPFRQEFQKHTVYEKKLKISSLDQDDITAIVYTIDLSGNNIPIIKYFLAKYGLVGTVDKLELYDVNISFGTPYIPDEEHYITLYNKDGLYISTPRMVWNANPVLQSFIWTVLNNSPKKMTNIEEVFDQRHWLESLGSDFKSKTVEKGKSMLESCYYSNIMKDSLKLPDADKESIFDVFKWHMYEFDALYHKDNYDMTYKKLRLSSYIAGFYAAKLSRNLISLSANANMDKVVKAIKIPHQYITDCLKTSNLASYKNGVNDDDTFACLKATFKGESGIGENKASAIPTKYRLVHQSQFGKVDCDTSPAGDPGMTCLLCPYLELEPGMYLGKYKEPNSWREEQAKVIEEFRKLTSKASLFHTPDELVNRPKEYAYIKEIMEKANNLMPYIMDDREVH